MTVVFVSHGSEDRGLTEEFADRLRAQGYHALFLDFDLSDGIPAGRRWEQELYAGLRRADGLVFLATPASLASRWCFAEVALARSLGMPVFGVVAKGSSRLSLLDDVQWVDLAAGEAAYSRLWTGMRRARLDPEQSFSWDPTRSPYPGLKAFSAADAAVFFGRGDETRHLVNLVQPTLSRGSGRWVTIVGPSGSGKSSLMCAGLLPSLLRVPERWVVVPVFVPGTRPTHHLAESLVTALEARGRRNPTATELAGRLSDAAEGSAALQQVARDLSDAAGRTSPEVLIAIDQAEEIISRNGQREQESFLRLLKDATGEDSPLWVVCTLRSEYLSSAPERAGLSEVTDDSVVLEPLSRNRLSEVIARPAKRAGLEFDPGLVERMVEDTTGGDALPLLAHTLYELAQRASTEDQPHISIADYEGLGGVVGALQRRADQLLVELTARGHVVVPTLLGLVTLDRDGQPIRRRLSRASLSDSERYVVDAFIDARLLSAGRQDGEQADVLVEVTHEALIRQWAPLREAIAASATSLRLRAELDAEAADWDAGAREESYLLRGARLASVEEWVNREGIQLGALEARFLEASRDLASRELRTVQRSNRRLRHLLLGVATLLVVAVVSVVVAVERQREVRRQADIALSRQLVAEARALRGIQPDVSLLLGAEAVNLLGGADVPESIGAVAVDARIALLQSLNRPFHVVTHHLRHEDAVRTVTFSPTGDVLASGGNDEVVRLWDASSGRPLVELAGHEDWVQGLAFSPDGSVLASSSHDGSIRLWDAGTGAPSGRPLTGHDGPVTGLAFHRDGTVLATSGEDGTVRLWDIATGDQQGGPLIDQEGEIWSVAFSVDGSLLASAGSDGVVRLWDMRSSRPAAESLGVHDGWAICVAFSKDGSRLATCGADGAVQLWDVTTRRMLSDPMGGRDGEVSDVAFNRDGSLLASAGRDGTVRLWDAWTGRPVGEPLRGHANAVRSVEFSPDGETVASSSFDHSVRVWQVAVTVPGEEPLTGHSDRITDLTAAHPDSPVLASASADGDVRVWPAPGSGKGDAVLPGHTDWVTGLAAHPTDAGRLVSGESDGEIHIWDVPSKEPLGSPLLGHEGEVSGVTVHPEGRLLASSGRDGTVRLWDLTTARAAPVVLTGEDDEMFLDVAFSPDGRVLAAGTQHGTLRTWDMTTADTVAARPWGEPLRGHTGWVLALAASPDSTLLASASGDGTIRLWDVVERRLRGSPLTGPSSEVADVAFSPDGSILVSANKDRTVRFWDVATGRPLGEPVTQPVEPTSLLYLRDGSLLAVGGADGSIRLLTTDARALTREACAIANRNLTVTEWDSLVGTVQPYRKTCARSSR